MNACENFYVAAGFREDCLELSSRFESLEDAKFQSFCKVWNDMKFSYVFSGRSTHSELIEFTEEALDIAKEFISPDKSYKTKIGGIYLLYGLYFTMPVSQPKIRMVYSEWENVLKLRCEICQNKNYEALYILKQLIEKNAFAYVCFKQERGLENYYLLKDFMRGNPQITQSQRKGNEWSQIFDNVTIQNRIYLMEKQKLGKFSAHLVPKVYNTDAVERLIETITKLDNVGGKSSSLSSHQSSERGNPPSTSTNTRSYAHRMKLDSGDNSDTSEESEDEDSDQ